MTWEEALKQLEVNKYTSPMVRAISRLPIDERNLILELICDGGNQAALARRFNAAETTLRSVLRPIKEKLSILYQEALEECV